MTELRAIGLMSGTSMDGVDVAVMRTDGVRVIAREGGATYPYHADLRRQLSHAIADATAITDRSDRPGRLGEIERAITDFHAEVVKNFAVDQSCDLTTVDIVGFHGQTVLHRPEAGLTVQLGDGQRLADRIGCRVAFDMRAGDVASGGQGAPLAPAYHAAMVCNVIERPIAVLNIGGVANVTWIGAETDRLIAFDTGPGNALLDDWMAKTVGAARDEGGAAALAGTADMRAVQFFLDDPFFTRPPPKSLDRNAFFWDMITGLNVRDGAATLVAMTVGAIARAVQHMPEPPQRWIVAGGGRHNQAMMQALADCLDAPVMPAEAIGYDGDTVEAEAWAYLAARSVLGLPLSFPGTTGVANAQTGGVVVDPGPMA